MIEGKGRFLKLAKGGGRLYIPSKIIYDSQFPFKETCNIEIKIEGNKIIVKKK